MGISAQLVKASYWFIVSSTFSDPEMSYLIDSECDWTVYLDKNEENSHFPKVTFPFSQHGFFSTRPSVRPHPASPAFPAEPAGVPLDVGEAGGPGRIFASESGRSGVARVTLR